MSRDIIRSDPDSNLCGNPEEIRHESDLPTDVAFVYSLNLPFSDDVHCLVPADRPPRRLETEEAETGIDSTFYESVVLLEDIIEVFALSELRGHGEHAFLLQLFDGGRISVVPIDVEQPWRLMLGSLQHLSEEAFSGLRIPFGAEHEIDRLAGGIDSAIEVRPFPYDFNVGLINPIRIIG